MDARDAAIARSIINLAHDLGFHVIAEGVETVEHFVFLREHGCTAFQGYFFGKPLPLEEFEYMSRLPVRHQKMGVGNCLSARAEKRQGIEVGHHWHLPDEM